MPKQDKSAKQLAAELEGLRRRAARLEAVVPKLQRVQAALRDAVNRFNVLFDRTPLACCVLRLDGTLADCNPAAEKFTGYRTAECIGTNLGALDSYK